MFILIVVDFVDIVRRNLINVVVEPVAEKDTGGAGPAHIDLFALVVGEIIFRRFDFKSLVKVAEILVFKGIPVILDVSRNKDVSVVG